MANSNTFHMSSDVLDAYAAQLDGRKQQLQDVLQMLDKSMNNVFDNSEGESIIAIQEKYSEICGGFERFIQLMEAYSNALRNIADQMNAVDSQIAKQIRTVS